MFGNVAPQVHSQGGSAFACWPLFLIGFKCVLHKFGKGDAGKALLPSGFPTVIYKAVGVAGRQGGSMSKLEATSQSGHVVIVKSSS